MLAVWTLSKALLWGERGGHVLISSHAATAAGFFFFFKALWPRKELYGMNDARTAESIERHQPIYTSRKKKMSTGQQLYTPWNMQRSSGRNNKHSKRRISVIKWGIKGEAIFPISLVFPKFGVLLKEFLVGSWCFPLRCKAVGVPVKGTTTHILKTGFIPCMHTYSHVAVICSHLDTL